MPAIKMPAGGPSERPLALVDVARLEVTPGDRLLVRVPDDLPQGERNRITDEFNDALPGVPVVVVDSTVDVTVIGTTDA